MQVLNFSTEYRIVARLRRAFTLLELLAVIAIIGILTGMVLYTLSGAQQDAKVARTQGTIKKISDVMLERWEEFRYRAVKINIPEQFLIPYRVSANDWQVGISPREGARARLIVLRDVMRMEFPDRYSDILYSPTKYRVAAFTADNVAGDTIPDDLVEPLDREVPGIYQRLRRKMIQTPVADPLSFNPYPWNAAVAPVGLLRPTIENQGAELLYQIVASSSYNGSSALEFFKPSEIGDTDDNGVGDGYPEFIDAWGHPIRWLRWPAGFVSPLNDNRVGDAMDPLKTDWRWGSAQEPWLLIPLIVSAGPDGAFDIIFDFDPNLPNVPPCVDPVDPLPRNPGVASGAVVYATNQWTGPTPASNVYTKYGPYYYPNPYLTINYQGTPLRLGQAFDLDMDSNDGSIDNISNYELILQ